MKPVINLMLICLLSLCAFTAHSEENWKQAYDDAYQTFKTPTNEYRGKPFWSWNGDLDKDELFRQIHVIDEMGFGGFFMHSRTGLATEYLGDEWFDLINACADEGEKLGLEAWLYDEDRWPSGSAGGLATENPAYRMKYLRMNVVPGAEFQWKDGIVSAFSCKLDGINYSDCTQLQKDSDKDAYQNKTVLYFTTEAMTSNPFYNGNTYLDTMNRKATDHFIELTHERYKKHCCDRLGKTIKGIFTDEPHRGMVMCKGVNNISNGKSEYLTPYTDSLFDDFEKAYGFDLTERLPELFLYPNGERIRKIKWQYMELIQQLFLNNFAKPIYDWCKQNDMILTGHVLHEDTLGSQAIPNGSLMRFYEYMDYPGVDILTEGNRNYWIVKQLSSAARQLGKKWLLSELYGCTGWQFSFASHKAVGDWQSLFGINLRCPHLSWYTMEGEAKRDYPASILHQSSWYKDYEPVETYFSRMQSVLTQGKPACDILVLNPIESSWAQIHAGWASWLSATTPKVVELDRKYQQLFHWLTGAHLDFDYGDEDMIHRHAKSPSGGSLLTVGEAQYKTVVVSGMETVRGTTLDLLEEFIDNGGNVLFVGEPPAYVDAEPSDRATQLAEKAKRVAFDRQAVLKACVDSIGSDVQILASDGHSLTDVFCQVRDDGPLRYVLALNVNREKPFADATIRIKGEGAVEEWDCLTGERCRIPAKVNGDYLEFTTDFPAMGERLYAVVPTPNEALKEKPELVELEHNAISGQFAYELSEPNLCVLDRARYKLDDDKWNDALEILKVDRSLRKQLDMPLRGGDMVQPWFSGKTEYPVKGRLSLQFDFQIETTPQNISLLMERPENFDVQINGNEIPSSSVDGWWIDACLKRLPIPADALKTGENHIDLQVDFHHGVNLEAVYLVGEFGVQVDGTNRTLTTLPESLEIGDVTAQRLPFYSGSIRYIVPNNYTLTDGKRAYLSIPSFEGACVKVSAGDKTAPTIAWPPYEADVTELIALQKPLTIDVVLTRRNTFGPLHQIPLRAGAYGPGNWITEGKSFTNNYMLYPAGLLEAPQIVWRKQTN